MANDDNKINIGDVWKDIANVQVNIGDAWKSIDIGEVNIGDSWKEFWVSGPPVGGDRGVRFGGKDITDAYVNVIDFVTISTTGNSTDFGNLGLICGFSSAVSNGGYDRGVCSLGYAGGSNVDTLEYITISSPGDSIDFGNLTAVKRNDNPSDNGTNDKGFFAGGYDTGNVDWIDWITVSTTGNAADWGDLTEGVNRGAACSNDINDRGIVMAGGPASETGGRQNRIDYYSLTSAGNASNFGVLAYVAIGNIYAIHDNAGLSNGTNERGISAGARRWTGHILNIIHYITINSLGNSTDFGDLLAGNRGPAGTSNKTNERGIISGGTASDKTTELDVIQYITINSAGNATDFGNLTTEAYSPGATSNS